MDVSPTDQRNRLQANLNALRVVAKPLADRLEALGEEAAMPLKATVSGFLTGRVPCEDGCEVMLASGRDPHTEASRWVDALQDRGEARHTTAIIGCGLGYHVAEHLRRTTGGLVVVLEPSLRTLHAALRCHDFTVDLLARRLVFVVEVQRSGLSDALAGYNVELSLGVQLTLHPVSGRALPKACSQIQRDLADYLQFVRSTMVTSMQISQITCDNVLQNLPYYIGSPGVGELEGAFAGRPGICVAAGPSLRKNLHLLRKIKGKVPIIAVQTVLRTLLAADIRPDFITSLDFSVLSRRFYEGLGDMADITLVADPKVNPIVPKSFPGPIRMFYNSFADRALAEMPNEHVELKAGATVAHLNMYLAKLLGCDPIILIGQDLGFGENVYYAPGVPIQNTWSPELNRFNSMEMMEWLRICRMGEHLRKTPGQNGHDIYTDAQMFSYLQQFERDIASTAQTVINASEGGARIAGTEQMTLAEALERYPVVDEFGMQRSASYPDAKARADTAVECLSKRIEALDNMEEICERVLPLLEEMTGCLDDPARFNHIHHEMDQWRRKIDTVQDAYTLVSSVTQLAELKRRQADHSVHRKDLDEIAERREQLARDIQYVSLLAEGIEALRISIGRACEGLEAMR